MAQDRKTPQNGKSPFDRTVLMNAFVAVASGAGGAILFFLAARGTWAGMVLSYFAPLPLMVATLGFGFAAGGAGVLAGALVAGLFGAPIVGLVVGGGLLLPAYLLSITALRAPGAPPADSRATSIVMVAMVFAAALSGTILVSLVMAHSGVAGARNAITSALLPVLRTIIQDSQFTGSITSEELARLIINVAPAVIAGSMFFMLVANIYLAGRVALISGRLNRPWPLIADTLALPASAAALLALSCGLVFVGGTVGIVSSIFVSVLVCGFSLQGLAVIHTVTRGMSVRGGLLFALYALIACVPPWPLLALALVGFIDAAFNLRQRRAKALSDKSNNRTE